MPERIQSVFTAQGFAGELILTITQEGPHYMTVWNGNPYQAMNIIIDSLSVDEMHLEVGDEVGVFDVDSSG